MGRLHAGASAVLVLALAIAGCGSSSSGSSSTSATSAGQGSSQSTSSKQASTATTPPEQVAQNILQISSPAFDAEGAISARYTCDGANISPPLSWSPIPKGAVELVLRIVSLERHTPDGHLVISWIVAGLSPGLTGIPAGKLPAGAIVGRNSFGQARYTICPPKGHTERYVLGLYALRHHLPVHPGFSASALLATAISTAKSGAGLRIFTYKRH